jgi:hypothetical protein
MSLNIVGSLTKQTGYGRMGRGFSDGLTRLGVQLDECSSPGDEHRPVHANSMWMGAPSHIAGWWKGQRSNCLTMWEATGVPPGFRENVHEIDTIIVPSQQNVELFSHWHDNVKKVPLGVDPLKWAYRPRPEVREEFRFFTAGQGSRKAIDVCIKAFNAVFGGFEPNMHDPIPRLIVKDRTKMKNVRGERITEMSGTISEWDEIELYGSAHCFLGLARGEGWGMMPFQAMAQGCPTILHDAHGHHEFAYLASAQIGTSLVKAERFIFGDAQNWWEPDFAETCEAMWDVYSNYEDYLAPAKHTAEVIRDEYTWDDSARKLIGALGGEKQLEMPDIEEREWYEPTRMVFQIIPSKNCHYEVNGRVYDFKKGEVYYEFGDLKRMMFENGNLDPACLTNVHESGLTDEQLSNLDRYKAQIARCPHCGQKYNSDMTLDFDDDEPIGELTKWI